MKRIFTLVFASVIAWGACFASSSIVTPVPAHAAKPALLKASDIIIPLGNTGKSINMQELATIKVGDLEKMTGKKMGLFQRMEFKMAQRKLRHSINADGTVSNKKLARLTSKDMDGETGFHLGGFALGLLLGLIGVLIAYLINDGKKSNRVKWAWIGCGVLVVILLLAAI
jgi:hypothetical protein